MQEGGGFNWMKALEAFGSINQNNEQKQMTQVRRLPTIADDEFTQSTRPANEMTQATDTVADAMGQIGGGFGQGFTIGYGVTKSITAPFLAYRAAKQEKTILRMKEQLSDWNAKSYQTAAEDVLRAGQQQVASLTFRAGQAKASTRVSQGASGIRVGGSGSAAAVLTSQAIVTEMQTNQILANAVTESFGYQRKKVQAKINSLAIRSARDSISPWASAICAHISSAASAAPSVGGAFQGLSGK